MIRLDGEGWGMADDRSRAIDLALSQIEKPGMDRRMERVRHGR
jgi:hypothetical protein